MDRLIIVSNRLPISVTKREGKFDYQSSIGGLATGLGSFYKSYNSLWTGWPGINSERLSKEEKQKVGERLMKDNCQPVFLSKREVENYYYGFSNRTIWPLFHYFTQHATYNKNLWKAYKRVNENFCSAIVRAAGETDTIWVHDYHLMLLPKLLRAKLPHASIGFFLHIPFPSFEVFRLLPWREEILSGLLGADLVGFHTYDYVQHFLNSVRQLLGYECSFGQVSAENFIVKVDAFPMGIDYKEFSTIGQHPNVQKEVKKIKKKVGNRKVILSVDRLDYTKGIPQRLEAFDYFLEKYPEYKEKITLILLAVPSRTKVVQYKVLKQLVDELIGRINGKHGTIDWMPVWYLYRTLPFHNLIALYSAADIALVTPLRDGMNLIAKEFIATKTDGNQGVLILSEMAGAAKELGEAIIVNPNNYDEIAEAIKTALAMSKGEQVEHNEVIQDRLKRYNVERWAKDFMDSLAEIKKHQQQLRARKMTKKIRESLIGDYFNSRRRLLLFDYDGTLVSFKGIPEKAKPDEELLSFLEALAMESNNELVIISGRSKEVLEHWFGNLEVSLVAEHGVWLKQEGGKWAMIESLRDDWKADVQPILEAFVDRTPGSFIEEKEFSLVWHYRKSDLELGSARATELKNNLLHFTANLNLDILEGNKVIEVKNSGINKGRAALCWITKKDWDFVLGVGDDWTDEDLFDVLPKSAHSIKVGLGPSKALYSLVSVGEVRSLLKEIAGQ